MICAWCKKKVKRDNSWSIEIKPASVKDPEAARNHPGFVGYTTCAKCADRAAQALLNAKSDAMA